MPGLVSREDDLLTVGHPVHPMPILLNAAPIEFPNCARPGRQQLQLGIGNSADCPFPIGRKIARHAFAQWDRRRPLHVAHRDRIGGSSLLALLVEQQRCCRRARYPRAATNPTRRGPAPWSAPAAIRQHAGALFIPGQQNPAVGRDILQRHSSRRAGIASRW